MSSDTTLNGKIVFESDWLGSVDLSGKDRVIEIEKVEIADLFCPRTNKKKKTLTLRIKGEPKGLICNQTNANTIGSVLKVTEASKWSGHRVILFPTTCQVGRETKTCIRVRDTLPAGNGKQAAPAKQAPDTQPAEPTKFAKYRDWLPTLTPDKLATAYTKFDTEVQQTLPEEEAQRIYMEFAKYAPQQQKDDQP